MDLGGKVFEQPIGNLRKIFWSSAFLKSYNSVLCLISETGSK